MQAQGVDSEASDKTLTLTFISSTCYLILETIMLTGGAVIMSLSETLKVQKHHKAGKVTFQDDPEEEEVDSRSVVEKIKMLERERDKLLTEIKELKKMAKSKANALESEVTMLREEAKVLKELLHLV